MKHFQILGVLLFMFFSVNSEKSAIKQLHIFFRHGERNPTHLYKNDPYINHTWSGGLGGLTNRGKYQIFYLGQQLKKHYKSFLPKYYYADNVTCLSSYSDRCKMSAQLLNAGLFPPIDEQIWNSELLWQPVPIKYIPRNDDNLIVMRKQCKVYDKAYSDMLNLEEVKNLTKTKIFDDVRKYTGEEIKTLEDMEFIFNTLDIEQVQNLTLPSWATIEILKEMKKIAAKNLALYTETKLMKRLKGGVFVKRVLDSMKNCINNKKQPTINLYAGHDVSLVHILRTLDLVDTIKPGFGATLIMELHEDSTLKVFYMDSYNDVMQEQIFKSCAKSCSINDFENIYHGVLPLDWEKECDN
ncbi:unnamed protein product [Brassicogethes aeneus]|uniref:Uncharacterized protein n=1 Tax=Brassicogethes aeneus TaxID=1431903 RepID=A0A9P0FNT4_BRAAE|nr:unnamed protein product [Brassicogethes aeneus]